MDNSLISGFITRKQAAECCERAERTLQRYWSKAIELQDMKVLKHLKLRTEDGQIIDGPDVTKEQIDQLRKSGRNPTWYADAEWVLETYGPRMTEREEKSETLPESVRANPEEGTHPSADAPLVPALFEQIEELKRDKQRLHEELSIKNEQIKEANARTRESNTLMQELQRMLGSWQDQAFRSLPAVTVPADLPPHESEKRNKAAKRKVSAKKRKTKSATKSKSSSAKTTKPSGTTRNARRVKWYETPTLKRLFSRSS